MARKFEGDDEEGCFLAVDCPQCKEVVLTYLDLVGTVVVRRCLGCGAFADVRSLRPIGRSELAECLPAITKTVYPTCLTGACGCKPRSNE